jgi:hypothetical protein
VERWRGGEVERWRGGEVERWRGGEVERWRAADAKTGSSSTSNFRLGRTFCEH